MTGIAWLNWAIMLVSIGVLVYLGIRASGIAEEDDEAGFLVAGRTLGPFVGAATIMATGFSGWGFMGSPGVAYEFGTIEVLGNFFFAPAIVIAILFFARFLQQRANEMGSNTIPEYIARWHGEGRWSRVLQGVAAFITVVLLLVFLTSQIKAVGLLSASFLNVSVTVGALIIVGVMIVYTMWGGLAGVAWTDTVMVVGMTVAAVIISFQIFGDMTPAQLISELNRENPELVNPTTADPYGQFRGSIFLVLVYAFMFAAVLPYMAIRFLAFKPDIKLHKAGLYAAPLGVILSLVPIVGLYVRAKLPPLEQADQAMPTYLDTFLPPALGGLITLFILFAMKSTANSLLHTVSSAVSHDLRLAFFGSRDVSPQRALLVNRAAVLVLGLTGLLMMVLAPPFLLSFLGILGTGTLFAAMAGPVFVSAFWLGNAYGALLAMVTGFVTSGGLLLYTDIGWVEGPLLGSLVSIIVYMVVSRLTFSIQPRRERPLKDEELAAEGTPEESESYSGERA